MKKQFLLTAFLLYLTTISAQTYNILKYKAKPGDKYINTAAIQAAVDDCAANGGGTVEVPAGTFITGMIRLKSHVNFHLQAGATLQALADGSKYASLLLAENVEDVSITGQGTLFGNGSKFAIGEEAPNRPYIIFLKNSRKVLVEDVRLLHGAAWALRLFGSEHVIIKNISIYSHSNFNNDGIDIDGKDVVVTGCIIDSGDDAICLKSDDSTRLCENITITNCIAASNCNLIKMGTSSFGGFKNISISNCVLRKASESPFHHWNEKPERNISERISGISGIALEIVDGGTMDQISISNITMTDVQTPIFIRLGSRRRATGVLKNVIITNIIATAVSNMCSTISAVPGFYIENVTLRDIFITCNGGMANADPNVKVPESEKQYPENRMFGWNLPAYGLFVRHARNIMVDNIRFNLLRPDARPAILLEDVKEITLNAPGLPANAIKNRP